MTEEKAEETVVAEKGLNVNKIIRKRNGDPLRQQPMYKENFEFCDECAKKVNEVRGEKMTVKSVVVNILDSMPKSLEKGEKRPSLKDKLRRGLLAEKIYNADGPIELPVDDLSLIKKLVGEVETPLVISQVIPEVDPASDKGE